MGVATSAAIPRDEVWRNDISAAIAAANASELDAIVQRVTAAWAKGTMSHEDYSALYGAAHCRRAALKGKPSLPLQGGSAERHEPEPAKSLQLLIDQAPLAIPGGSIADGSFYSALPVLEVRSGAWKEDDLVIIETPPPQ